MKAEHARRLQEDSASDNMFGKERTTFFDDPEARREHFKVFLGWDEGEAAYSPIDSDAPFHHKNHMRRVPRNPTQWARVSQQAHPGVFCGVG